MQATTDIKNKIAHHFKNQTLGLADITGFSVNELFLKLGFLLSTEIWNTFGTWVKNAKPKLSPGVELSLSGYAESASRSDIQKNIFDKRLFQKRLNDFLCYGNVLCFPTTVDLAPRLDDITPDFLAGDYVPRAMSVNAISCLSRTPQITIPIAEADGVPLGLSFIAGYGQDMMLIELCNKIYNQCVVDC